MGNNQNHDSNKNSYDNYWPKTNDGQPFSLEPQDYGNKSEQHLFIDSHEYDYQENFPKYTPAKTGFYAYEAGDKEVLFNRLWKLQHGRGHTYEGWEQRVRPEDSADFSRASAILSQLDIENSGAARQRVMNECVNGFNRHYSGFDGACVGFALLYENETVEEAKNSHLLEKAGEMIDADCERLAEYVFRKYGGDEQ